MTCETCELFDVYFNVADELWGGLTLTDLDRDYVRHAREAQRSYDLPWPPYLPAAEELQLDMQNGRYRGEHNPFKQHKEPNMKTQFACTECDKVHDSYEEAANCHPGIGGVVEVDGFGADEEDDNG
jgi:hypothetical protein